jgi:hypothetical protein
MAFSILIARQIIPTAEIRDGPVLGFVRGEPKTFLGQPLSDPAAAKVAIPAKSVDMPSTAQRLREGFIGLRY